MKFGGGTAGHNGLRDIAAQLGGSAFWRLRLGIGHPRDSAIPQQPVVDYVLQPPRADERKAIDDGARAGAGCVAADRRRRFRARDDGASHPQGTGTSMSLKCGIVGLPNVGKSTLFNALTKAGIAAENYPFCTIEPNVGIVEVPDPRLAALAAIARPERVMPAVVEFVDIAGLVAGASKGEGLGNKFLANIRETDAIAHVVRCFVDENVVHVAGGVNPVSDIETINTELALADLATVEKQLQKYEKAARAGGDKEAQRLVAVLKKVDAVLNEGRPARTADLYHEEITLLEPLFLLTMKPTMYVANVADGGFHDNPLLAAVEAHAAKEGAPVVAVCAAMEAEIADLDGDDKLAFLADMGLAEPGLDRVIHAGYKLLGLSTYFTVGPKEVRAWTIHVGDTAPRAAGVIHTDFEHGFIRAEVIAYDDFIACKGEHGAKEAGKMRLEGKEYVVKDGDVLHFRFNV